MKRPRAFAAGTLVVAACGARTSLEVPAPVASGAPRDAGTAVDAGAEVDAEGPPDAATPVDAGTDAAPPPPDAVAPDVAPPGLVAYAESSTTLYAVELPSGAITTIGATGDSLYDIAFVPSGSLYGTGAANLDLVDPASGATTSVAPLPDLFNGLGATPDGSLYGAGGGGVSRIDPSTGTATFVASFPAGFSSSGDLAAVEGVLYASATNGTASDFLLSVDVVAGTTTIIGPIGYACVYGLAAFGPTLYGFTCAGEIVGVDPASGVATLVASTGVTFFGAAAR